MTSRGSWKRTSCGRRGRWLLLCWTQRGSGRRCGFSLMLLRSNPRCATTMKRVRETGNSVPATWGKVGVEEQEAFLEVCEAVPAPEVLLLGGGVERAELAPEEVARVKLFLALRGFANVKAKRRRFLKSSYPLHVAVADNDADMVRLLVRLGADPLQKNSSGLTPEQLARKNCKRGASEDALLALGAIP